MKVFRIWIVIAAIFLTSCLSDSAQEKATGISGTWYAHDPILSTGIKYVGYFCFGEKGEYNFFDLSSRDTLDMAKVSGMQRSRGSWILMGDTLKILETARGFLNDTNGVGEDWLEKMEMKPYSDSSRVRIRIQEDSMFIYRPDGESRTTSRQKPHAILKAVCPN